MSTKKIIVRTVALDTVGLPLRYKKSAKIDKITEKRHFPMDFFAKLSINYNHIVLMVIFY